MSGASIVAAEEARFFGSLIWTYPTALVATHDGSVTIAEQTTTHGLITGPAVDCSNFVYQAMLAAGYSVPYLTTAQMAALIAGGTSSSYTVDPVSLSSPPQVGDIIVFTGANGQGHCGIVTGYNSATGVVTFDNAQNSGKGLMQGQTCQAAIGSSWGSNDTVLGYLTVNSSAYNPTAAASTLNTINAAIDQGLYNYGAPEYFSTSITSPSISSVGSIVGGDTPAYADVPGDASWSTTIITPGTGDQSGICENETH